MFNWFNKKKKAAAAKAAHDEELRGRLADKMDRWSKKPHDSEKSEFTAITDYTLIDGQLVKVNRVSMGNTQTNIGDTVPDLTLAENTDDRVTGTVFDKRLSHKTARTNIDDPWGQADPSDTGRWKRNN